MVQYVLAAELFKFKAKAPAPPPLFDVPPRKAVANRTPI